MPISGEQPPGVHTEWCSTISTGARTTSGPSLGATVTSFARPYLYGLAAGGEAGVNRALDILATELRRDMILLGARSIGQLDESCIRRLPRTV